MVGIFFYIKSLFCEKKIIFIYFVNCLSPSTRNNCCLMFGSTLTGTETVTTTTIHFSLDSLNIKISHEESRIHDPRQKEASVSK
jgi:hypothetical protein